MSDKMLALLHSPKNHLLSALVWSPSLHLHISRPHTSL